MAEAVARVRCADRKSWLAFFAPLTGVTVQRATLLHPATEFGIPSGERLDLVVCAASQAVQGNRVHWVSTLLLLKLFLVPSLIVGITFAGRKWGPAVAGWLSGFPVVSGPILYFMAAEQGIEFASTAATATLSAVLAIVVFGLSYAWAATRFEWAASLAFALVVYFGAVALLNALPLTLGVAAPAVVMVLWFVPRFFPAGAPKPSKLMSARGELLLRIVSSAALVVGVTYAAASLGPQLSGLLAMFPVINSVLAVFSHLSQGRDFTVRLLRGMVLGYYAFATFCLVLALTLIPLGVPASFTLAVGCATLVQATSRKFVRSRA